MGDGSDFEKLTVKALLRRKLKYRKIKDRDGDVACDALSSGRSLAALNSQVKARSDTEEGGIIGSPEADAASKQQSSDGFPPSTKESVADHKAVSHNLGKRKHMDDDAACRLCGKNFPSMKALYGHMRSHERNWRGLTPPPEVHTLVPIPAADFKSSNIFLPPLKSSVIAKRHRKAKAAANPRTEEELEDPLINAAKNLMFLANGGFSLDSTPARQQQNRNSVPYNSKPMSNEDDLKISTTAQMDADTTGKSSNQNINNSVIDCNGTVDMSSGKPTKKKDDLEIVTELAGDQKQYLCTACNKSFSTHQALGGHTASHNKGKSNAGVEEAKLAQAEGNLIGQSGGSAMKVSEHRCKICSLVFPTGQALGGHMRKHWTGPENVAAPSSSENGKKANQTSSSSENATKATQPSSPSENAPKAEHRYLDIDINEPAPPEDAR
ncbi:zinc finger protein ZAT1-like [Phoenix dactylifera]|uniref:Zinc finger protein ZAT1-like n=1 Tax=Phoenix dactylifera TaxID=42345 RepID=A0A8B9AIR5_PHODC|nr:zinc finger protein ZAT1-like [Phoenix dactylifera]XP_038983891.1 zinc finger protein ZAT1-like [Phoenix dactylifera]XP_038983892.1 zinc finger protein ZAT1-like [Phoenix dactylifera]XP_038983893.1 zinc finger protein ZAT1-like [Phoenix dactylifera]